LSLKELADARLISVASAARLMRRRRWRRQPGNDGHIRVFVPAGEQEPKTDARTDDRADVRPEVRAERWPDIIADISEVIGPLQDAIGVLEAQLSEANSRAAKAEQAVAGERVRADVLRDRLEALQAELRQAQDAAAALRQARKAARAARGRLRRAWAARRGREGVMIGLAISVAVVVVIAVLVIVERSSTGKD
jgi:hypothetical protein